MSVAAWQIIVPISATPRVPKSHIKIEFANVPAYEKEPKLARVMQGLVQVQDVILAAESANEILADKAVALTARAALKYRDVWDVWYLINKLGAQADRGLVAKKFNDYGTLDIETKAELRRDELGRSACEKPFLDEMKRFLPAKRVSEMIDVGLHRAILAASSDFLSRAVLPTVQK